MEIDHHALALHREGLGPDSGLQRKSQLAVPIAACAGRFVEQVAETPANRERIDRRLAIEDDPPVAAVGRGFEADRPAPVEDDPAEAFMVARAQLDLRCAGSSTAGEIDRHDAVVVSGKLGGDAGPEVKDDFVVLGPGRDCVRIVAQGPGGGRELRRERPGKAQDQAVSVLAMVEGDRPPPFEHQPPEVGMDSRAHLDPFARRGRRSRWRQRREDAEQRDRQRNPPRKAAPDWPSETSDAGRAADGSDARTHGQDRRRAQISRPSRSRSARRACRH